MTYGFTNVISFNFQNKKTKDSLFYYFYYKSDATRITDEAFVRRMFHRRGPASMLDAVGARRGEPRLHLR